MGKKVKVFLGGTCNDSVWRENLIPLLEIDFFNPVVDDWTPECQEEELRQRELCDICLYHIDKNMTGVYSIAEVVDDSNKRPEKTVFSVDFDGFKEGHSRSLRAVGRMVKGNGGTFIENMSELVKFLNSKV